MVDVQSFENAAVLGGSGRSVGSDIGARDGAVGAVKGNQDRLAIGIGQVLERSLESKASPPSETSSLDPEAACSYTPASSNWPSLTKCACISRASARMVDVSPSLPVGAWTRARQLFDHRRSGGPVNYEQDTGQGRFGQTRLRSARKQLVDPYYEVMVYQGDHPAGQRQVIHDQTLLSTRWAAPEDLDPTAAHRQVDPTPVRAGVILPTVRH